MSQIQEKYILSPVYFPQNPSNNEPEVTIAPPIEARQFGFVYLT